MRLNAVVLRVGDIARDVFPARRTEARKPPTARRKCAEDTHDIFSNSCRAAWPHSGEDVASVVPKSKVELDQSLK